MNRECGCCSSVVMSVFLLVKGLIFSVGFFLGCLWMISLKFFVLLFIWLLSNGNFLCRC